MPNPTRTAGYRLTDRDRKALYYVAGLRAVRRDDLATLLATFSEGLKAEPLGDRTTRDVVARWVALGLATSEPYAGQGPAVVYPTRAGAQLVRVAVPSRPSWTESPHTLTTAAVAVMYLNQLGGIWQAESLLRPVLPKGAHLPDGVWLRDAESDPVAVEVERNVKARERWAGIAADLLRRYARVAYWATPDTGRAWSRWAEDNLVRTDRERVELVDLEQMGAAR